MNDTCPRIGVFYGKVLFLHFVVLHLRIGKIFTKCRFCSRICTGAGILRYALSGLRSTCTVACSFRRRIFRMGRFIGRRLLSGIGGIIGLRLSNRAGSVAGLVFSGTGSLIRLRLLLAGTVIQCIRLQVFISSGLSDCRCRRFG